MLALPHITATLGSPHASVRVNSSPDPALEAWFWRRFAVGENGCREWTRGRDAEGYGVVRFWGRPQKAHRVAWILTNGPIPEETPFVLHRCDNPPCGELTHLFLGTQVDNVHDRMAKNRFRHVQFERRGRRSARWEQHPSDLAHLATVTRTLVRA